MNYEVEILETALIDMDNIYSYIAYALKAEQAAQNIIDELEKGILSLDTFPKKYGIYDHLPWSEREVRKMPLGDYLIFYRIREDQKKVRVYRVIYGASDVDKHLGDI